MFGAIFCGRGAWDEGFNSIEIGNRGRGEVSA